jgi:hypothetical protein
MRCTAFAIGGQEDRFVFVAAGDDVKQQIRVTVAIGEVAELVNDQHIGPGVVLQSTAQGVVAVLCGEIAEHLGGVDEQRAMALEHGVVGDVLGDHGLADPVGSDEDEVRGIVDEAQAHQRREARLIAVLGPLPVEVGQRFEAADVRGAQATFQTAPASFGDFPFDDLLHPGELGLGECVEVGQ